MANVPQTWRPDTSRFDVHAYFSSPVVETVHELTEAAAEACEACPDLSPGLDCCAVCGKLPGSIRGRGSSSGGGKPSKKGGTPPSQQHDVPQLVACEKCQRVVYCCKEHRIHDAPTHARVCRLLSLTRHADAVSVTDAALRTRIAQFPRTCAELSRKPLRSWCSVVPGRCYGEGVWMRHAAAGAAAAGAAGAAAPAASTSGRSHDRADLISDGNGNGSPPLPHTIVELAVASSLLSYPLTLLHCCMPPPDGVRVQPASLGAASLAVKRCWEANADVGAGSGPSVSGSGVGGAVDTTRPLVVCVLGASEEAELAQPQVWDLLTGLVPHRSSVLLQFVGPQVPQRLHNTSESRNDECGRSDKGGRSDDGSHSGKGGRSGGSGVRCAYWCGEYGLLVMAARAGAARGADVAAAGGCPLPAGTLLHADLCRAPDMFVGYNMGVTCGDYDWEPSLAAMELSAARRSGDASGDSTASSSAPVPLVVTCNTRAEAEMEAELFGRAGWAVRLPVCANPLVALELMQSGTLGNDVYRKNAWLAVYDVSAQAMDLPGTPKKSKKRRAKADAHLQGPTPPSLQPTGPRSCSAKHKKSKECGAEIGIHPAREERASLALPGSSGPRRAKSKKQAKPV